MSETPDQAATRRRWISLAELVAVSGLIIGALTLWMNWSDKRHSAAEKAAERVAATAAEARFSLQASLTRDGSEVELVDPRHDLLETTITFPSRLKVAPKSPATARIEKDWFADAVLQAMDGGADSREGRLPVLVTASYRSGNKMRSGSAIVEIVWRTRGNLLRGRSLSLEAARVRELRGTAKAVDRLWADELKRQSERA
ncbi:hypothetical protein [Sphingomonas sp.]|uniref:hypothetical protein n=1 Tax=Sphingomonas sp. TaxID=28214 RepID=UPI002631BBA6|nr:hypothetical protein [Sphingomonas sp.]MDF2603438.1 hypothetical protein [Sphingomonas sp.]